MKHEILYPGMDYEKCSVCGYIATDYLIEEFTRKLERLRGEDSKKTSKVIIELSSDLTKFKKQRNCHLLPN